MDFPSLEQARADLEQIGIYIGANGMPLAEDTTAEKKLDWNQLPTACEGVTAKMRAIRNAKKREDPFAKLDREGKARMLSASGRTAGMWLQASEQSQANMTDEEFRRSARWRIGFPQCQEGVTCQHKVTDQNNTACPRNLDVAGLHAVACKLGKATARMHEALCYVVCDILRPCGYPFVREKVIPQWARWTKKSEQKKDTRGRAAIPKVDKGTIGQRPQVKDHSEVAEWICTEAIIDIAAVGPEGDHFLIDMTHRLPVAERYLVGDKKMQKASPAMKEILEARCASRTPGIACLQA